MFHSLQLKIKTKDPIRLSPNFKRKFSFVLIQNTDNGGEFIFQSSAVPIEFYDRESTLKSFNQQLTKFVKDFEIVEVHDLIYRDPYLAMTVKIYTTPNSVSTLLPLYQNQIIKKTMFILRKKFRHVFLKEAMVISFNDPNQNTKSNS